ncbi:type I methionyl aminopeptidase [candidate division KSB1 bacterium]|nr:type I methionyl aminopeptidase [candidate division KSB1 bacterium]
MIPIKNSHEIDAMRKSARLVARSLGLAGSRIRPGLRTVELDEEIADFIYSNDAKPAFKNFNGYPANICVSVNDQIVHGIPGNRVLEEGDIVSVDVGVELEGYFGDSARTFAVGQISNEKQRLLTVTEAALIAGIEQAKEGNRLHDIGHAVQQTAEQAGFSVVRDLVGHGIGRALHEPPEVPNFGNPGSGPRLQKGMVLAIEPMINLGSHEIEVENDRWTIITRDGRPSAHFEHTIVITDRDPEVLTKE